MKCTLCQTPSFYFCEDKKRQYFQCTECKLVFADPASYLLEDDEKAIYDFHQNDPKDARYRAFLSQLSEPLIKKLSTGMQGLDFGCGPGPVLSLMMEEQGIDMSLYDIYYAPHNELLTRQFDVVVCTEVVEHFYEPYKTWPQLIKLVKTGGWLGLMTSLFTRESPEFFKAWQYKNDPTHVSFYTPATLYWIAERFGLNIEIVSNKVILLQRS